MQKIRNIARHAGRLALIGLAAQLAGCGGGGDTPAPHGSLRVALTNTGSSSCGYEEVNISIDTVRANQSAGAGPNEGTWQPKEVTLVQAKTVDLISLIGKPAQDLVTISLPAGHYAQVRIWLEDRSVLVAMPNSVVRTRPKELPLDISSATSIGIPHEFNVPANGQADLVLDFDACSSVVDKGDDTFVLDPKIKVVPTAGT